MKLNMKLNLITRFLFALPLLVLNTAFADDFIHVIDWDARGKILKTRNYRFKSESKSRNITFNKRDGVIQSIELLHQPLYGTSLTRIGCQQRVIFTDELPDGITSWNTELPTSSPYTGYQSMKFRQLWEAQYSSVGDLLKRVEADDFRGLEDQGGMH